jgi:hypothetical protein
MHIFRISESNTSRNPRIRSVLEGLNETKDRRVKIYNMESCGGGRTFIFRTTSKDVFLGLGAMTTKLQENLAWLLELEFQKEDRGDGLLLFIDGDPDALLVTRTHREILSIFTFAPAR